MFNKLSIISRHVHLGHHVEREIITRPSERVDVVDKRDPPPAHTPDDIQKRVQHDDDRWNCAIKERVADYI
jgi:hypothetical protein